MSIWPFNRKNKQQQSAVANEIQDYYQSERRERKGVAWLLAIATFFVTLFAVLVLFYGGKWVYNKIRSNDEPAATDIVQEQDSSQTDQSSDQKLQPQDQNQPSPSNSDSQVSGQNDAPQTSSTNTTVPSQGPSASVTPVTGPSTEELPRTGPDQDL